MPETTRALVLGSGGITGIAWELGILAGLAEAGVRLTEADLVVGTSAGAVVGAELALGRPVEELYARQFEPADTDRPLRTTPGMMVRYAGAMLPVRNATAGRVRLGRLALEARDLPMAWPPRDSGSPSPAWPAGRRLVVAAVDAGSGRLRTFDAASGVDLTDAVSASHAVPLIWPPVAIDGRHYLDGGMRSPANADLAADADRVVVLAPLTRAWRLADRPQRQVAALPSGVARLLVTPDRAARRATGWNTLNAGKRPAAALAGRAQAAAVADAVRAVWS
ncbi:MAG: patatin-like phospholipase family protein [Actinomycetales bacterium]|nr:patatin-like phospholipase family protein [Actinomycetales bacterium]